MRNNRFLIVTKEYYRILWNLWPLLEVKSKKWFRVCWMKWWKRKRIQTCANILSFVVTITVLKKKIHSRFCWYLFLFFSLCSPIRVWRSKIDWLIGNNLSLKLVTLHEVLQSDVLNTFIRLTILCGSSSSSSSSSSCCGLLSALIYNQNVKINCIVTTIIDK